MTHHNAKAGSNTKSRNGLKTTERKMGFACHSLDRASVSVWRRGDGDLMCSDSTVRRPLPLGGLVEGVGVLLLASFSSVMVYMMRMKYQDITTFYNSRPSYHTKRNKSKSRQ